MDRYVAPERGVLRAVHLAHAGRACGSKETTSARD
jgi:hypothetical protein